MVGASAKWADEPLTSAAEDDLDRGEYADRAAALVASLHSFESSSVVGLSGPWGSGKTSLVNMIVESLQREHPEWIVARFTPWATSDVPGLLSEFYSSIAHSLPSKAKNVRKALALTALVAAPATALIPVAGGSVATLLKRFVEASQAKPPWDIAFAKASAQLRELGRPILVVVDDIDRLQPEELMALLRVVRQLGRFDGVDYLLAYDDETVFRTLAAAQIVDRTDGTAERFMEKIVQYPLFVPPLLRHQQLARINRGLAHVSRDDPNEDGRLDTMLDVFLALLRTPRSIDRYLAQLEHHLPLVPQTEMGLLKVRLTPDLWGREVPLEGCRHACTPSQGVP
ncbi:AAA family ATPase [Phycicoccus sp. HDW14]|uniref:KAP family NTPase n=1 Tax=Phycicoccus sp. HDW14 TaxID=2714941 RepID=UPI00140D2E5B|nr:KAP family NTPase [Phycicoccus sp. HDW14]QIM22135.1 AAA family ATPase [Phycicoccus sp. HDW14]